MGGMEGSSQEERREGALIEFLRFTFWLNICGAASIANSLFYFDINLASLPVSVFLFYPWPLLLYLGSILLLFY